MNTIVPDYAGFAVIDDQVTPVYSDESVLLKRIPKLSSTTLLFVPTYD
jgi:hypothetical protein